MNKISQIKITNPEKIITNNIKKIDVISYYKKISKNILPFICDRPLSEIRCHNGLKDCFFRKHPDKTNNLIYVPSEYELISQVQMGTLEFHLYPNKAKNKSPFIMIFDLDPDENLDNKNLTDAVLKLKNLLDELNLVSFLKTSGGKGYHVLVPFLNVKSYKKFEEFSQKVAKILEVRYPNIFTTNIRKDMRKGKIFLDYLRNKQGSTCVAPYSLRARENLPISFPISWKNLNKIKPNEITILNYQKYLKTNPWKNFFNVNQQLK